MIDWDSLVVAPLHAAFGEAVTYQSRTAGTFALSNAIFDRGYIQVVSDAGVPVTTMATTLGIRLASCPAGFAPAQGDKVSARGSTWNVADIQPDGKGNAVLILGVSL